MPVLPGLFHEHLSCPFCRTLPSHDTSFFAHNECPWTLRLLRRGAPHIDVLLWISFCARVFAHLLPTRCASRGSDSVSEQRFSE